MDRTRRTMIPNHPLPYEPLYDNYRRPPLTTSPWKLLAPHENGNWVEDGRAWAYPSPPNSTGNL